MTVGVPVRVALSGCGAVSERYYAPALRALGVAGRLRVVGLADPDPARRAVLGARFPAATRVAELADLLAAEPQLVIVAAPPQVHAEQAMAALAAGAAVLCEKPLAPTRADAVRMIAAATAADRLLAVGMVRRQLPAARTIRRLLADGILGTVERFEGFEGGPFAWPVHSPAYFDRANGGVLRDIGAHLLDLLTWWLGPPADVVAEDDAMGGVEANALVTLRCGGVRGRLRLSRDWQRPGHLTITGTRGTLTWPLDETERVVLTMPGGPPLAIAPLAPPGAAMGFEDAFARQIVAVLDALAHRPAEVVPASELLPSITALEQATSGATLAVPPWLAPGEQAAARACRAERTAVRARPARSTVAVVGANGFIGSRLVEMLHLGGEVEVRPIVRRGSALVPSARFALAGRVVSDARDAAALGAALAGAEHVVHCVAGDPATITESAAAVYHAAAAAGCRRLVYVSSAAVHGQAPAPGTDEASPLSDHQPIAYNTAKVRAERLLAELRARGRLELVVLRPAIVFGPRSTWIAGLADALADGTAHFAGRADGICNSLYVDNLVHAITLALATPAADRATYLLGDAEAPTWRELYRPFAAALGADVDTLPIVPWAPPRLGLAEGIDRVRRSAPVQEVLRRLPERLRLGLVAFYAAATSADAAATSANAAAAVGADADATGSRPAPLVTTQEMALLHGCTYRLPWTKAERELGYHPPVDFAEAVRRTIGWLAFAGYPVRPEARA